MQQANVRLRLNKVGSDIPITGVTPAEALLLHVLHQGNNGGLTYGDKMDSIENITEVTRTDAEEVRRLKAKYGQCVNKHGVKIVTLIWPGVVPPQLPQRFNQLKWAEIQFDGAEVAAVDYSTGKPMATSNLPTK